MKRVHLGTHLLYLLKNSVKFFTLIEPLSLPNQATLKLVEDRTKLSLIRSAKVKNPVLPHGASSKEKAILSIPPRSSERGILAFSRETGSGVRVLIRDFGGAAMENVERNSKAG